MKYVIIFLVSLFLAANTFAISIFDWKTIETQDFEIFYPKGYEIQAKEVLYYLEKYQPQVKKLTGNQNEFKTRVVIQDTGMLANGYADSINTKISVFAYDPYPSSTQSWQRLVSVHELIHINQFLNISGPSKAMTAIFGNSYSPNVVIPMWMVEGITVYGESQITPYEGRLNYGYYNAIVSAQAKAGKLPDVSQANYSFQRYPGDFYYNYGGVFFDYLAKTYGEDKFAKFFKLYGQYYWAPFIGAAYPFYGLDYAAIKVYGRPFPVLFYEWKKYEEQKARDWKIEGKVAQSTDGLCQSSYLTAQDSKLYYFKRQTMANGPFAYYSFQDLIEKDPLSGQEKIIDTETAGPLTYVKKFGNKLYLAYLDSAYGFANVDSGGRGSIAMVYVKDLKTERREYIFSDELNDFAILNNQAIVYIKQRKDAFGSEIWQYSNGQKTKIGKTNQLIGQILTYKDKFIVVSQKRAGSWNINYLDLVDFSLTPIVAGPWHEYNAKIVGDKLYYTSNCDRQVITYEHDLISKTNSRLSAGSFSDDGVVVDDQLYFLGVSAEGKYLYQSNLQRELFMCDEKDPDTEHYFAFEPKENNALVSNLKYGLWPTLRFFPLLAGGQDGLGYNQYNIYYASDGGFDFAISSKLFMPIDLAYYNTYSLNERKHALAASYPVYLSSSRGLSALYLTMSTDFAKVFPGITASLSAPRNKVNLLLQNDWSDGGLNGSLSHTYLLDEGSFNSSVNLFADFDKVRYVKGFPAVSVKNTTGYFISLQCLRRIAKVRYGLWNPNIFIGDIYAGPFIELLNMNQKISSIGYEVQLEAGTGFWISFVPKVGLAYANQETRGYYSFGISF